MSLGVECASVGFIFALGLKALRKIQLKNSGCHKLLWQNRFLL